MVLVRFAGREASIVVLNAMMDLPPVVVGLALFGSALANRLIWRVK